MAMMLQGRPNLPRDQRAGGRGRSFRMRRAATQTMEIRYVAIRATVLRESMALKATVLPMLIKETRMVKMQVKIMALTGTWKRLSTCKGRNGLAEGYEERRKKIVEGQERLT